MQKATPMAGVNWKEVKASGLTPESQKLYQKYVDAFDKVSALARELKEQVQTEWDTKFPNGVSGKVCTFNAIGGVLLYATKDKDKAKGERVKKVLDVNKGEDVFNA